MPFNAAFPHFPSFQKRLSPLHTLSSLQLSYRYSHYIPILPRVRKHSSVSLAFSHLLSHFTVAPGAMQYAHDSQSAFLLRCLCRGRVLPPLVDFLPPFNDGEGTEKVARDRARRARASRAAVASALRAAYFSPPRSKRISPTSIERAHPLFLSCRTDLLGLHGL